MDDSYQLSIWHPLALPSDRQSRDGLKRLEDPRFRYPVNVSRKGREEAINAVKAFVTEAEDALAPCLDEDRGMTAMGAALHVHYYLSPNAGPRAAAAIAQLAQRHGLAFYDPQGDLLTLPPARDLAPLDADDAPTLPDEPGVRLDLGPWSIRTYPQTTKSYYTRITESGSDRCECPNCRNFSLARSQVYPSEIAARLESAGVDLAKESEVHYYGRTAAGLHTYRGWIYLVGEIERGPEAWHHPANGDPQRRFHRVGQRFEFGLCRKSDYGYADWETVLIAAGFSTHPCVEADFYVDVPWVSSAPEPA